MKQFILVTTLLCITTLGLVLHGGVIAEPVAYAALGQPTPGSAVGTVTFMGEPPAAEQLPVTQNKDICGLEKVSKTFIVSGETKGLKNVVVSIVGAPSSRVDAAASGPKVAQHICEYDPHVQTALVGQQLEIVNQDNVLHNIHAYGDEQATLFNLAQPIQNMLNKVSLDSPGVVTVKCDVHRWMLAYIVVAEHGYTAVTNENGEFQIDGIPPGTYTIRTWHEALGELDKEITIVAGQQATVSFDVGN